MTYFAGMALLHWRVKKKRNTKSRIIIIEPPWQLESLGQLSRRGRCVIDSLILLMLTGIFFRFGMQIKWTSTHFDLDYIFKSKIFHIHEPQCHEHAV